ncbi:hypothetical protein ACFYXQ_03740 [Nocardia jiangxiensis]|uniref:Uncharacterized protein n=1 Tax=Nocardia jiangxiensis TaxID=282685 RepID=A0ABW6RS89_9NOCA
MIEPEHLNIARAIHCGKDKIALVTAVIERGPVSKPDTTGNRDRGKGGAGLCSSEVLDTVQLRPHTDGIPVRELFTTTPFEPADSVTPCDIGCQRRRINTDFLPYFVINFRWIPKLFMS